MLAENDPRILQLQTAFSEIVPQPEIHWGLQVSQDIMGTIVTERHDPVIVRPGETYRMRFIIPIPSRYDTNPQKVLPYDKSPRSTLAISGVAGESDREATASMCTTSTGEPAWEIIMPFMNRSPVPVEFPTSEVPFFRTIKRNSPPLSGIDLLMFAYESAQRDELRLMTASGRKYSVEQILQWVEEGQHDILSQLLSSTGEERLMNITLPLAQKFGIIRRTQPIQLATIRNRARGLLNDLGLEWVNEQRFRQEARPEQRLILMRTASNIDIPDGYSFIIEDNEHPHEEHTDHTFTHSRSILLDSGRGWPIIAEYPIRNGYRDLPKDLIVKVYKH